MTNAALRTRIRSSIAGLEPALPCFSLLRRPEGSCLAMWAESSCSNVRQQLMLQLSYGGSFGWSR